ncbi:MAG: (Fe-S)-binding protein [bacterium]
MEQPIAQHAQVVEWAKNPESWGHPVELYLEICARCGTCAEVCHVYQGNPCSETNPAKRADFLRTLYKSQATFLGRLFSRFRLTEAVVDEWARAFYSCSACRRCAQYCPLGIDNSVITRKARAILHRLGKTPKKLADTQDVSDQFGNDEGVTAMALKDMLSFLEDEIRLDKGVQVSIPVDEPADILFVPPSADLFSSPEVLMGCAIFFHAAGLKWTMCSQAFDGANFGLFTGDEEHIRRKNKRLYDACVRLRVKKLVMGECGHAYRVAKQLMPTFWGPLPFEVVSIFTLASGLIRDGAIRLDPSRNPMPVTYHDPCNYTRSCGLVEEPRVVLQACADQFIEMTPNRYENWCCGGGGGLAVLDGNEGVAGMDQTFEERCVQLSGKKKAEQVRKTGAQLVSTPCANCRRQMKRLMNGHGMDVQVVGVFDLLARAAILSQ